MAPAKIPARPLSASRLSSRLSQLSQTSSNFEADDERSSTGSPDSVMSPRTSSSSNGNRPGPGLGVAASPPGRYPGEDTRPTSSKELAGWYAYAFAGEVYVICG
jgi:UMF1 family MFS transporter